MAQPSRKAECVAERYGKCGGQMQTCELVYHCRPRAKDLDRGHAAYDDKLKVLLCEKHQTDIAEHEANKHLPEVYGWDITDALDGMTSRLKYTGKPDNVYCEHCTLRQQPSDSETGACTENCIFMQKMYGDSEYKWQCKCNEPYECLCASYNNNAVHWAVLTYVNGFEYETYNCEACDGDRPSWRDLHTHYKDYLVKKEKIVSMAKANPELLLEKNANDKTPLELIPEMIASLEETIKGEYLKCAEYGWAKSNIDNLNEIKKRLMEVLV
jgi:hypothetical protein